MESPLQRSFEACWETKGFSKMTSERVALSIPEECGSYACETVGVYNPGEATIIHWLVKCLLAYQPKATNSRKILGRDILVFALLPGQSLYISSIMTDCIAQGVTVATVNYENQPSKPIVILSMGQNNLNAEHNIGAIADNYKLCKGLTQARDVLCMVGAFTVWANPNTLRKTKRFRAFNALLRDLDGRGDIFTGEGIFDEQFWAANEPTEELQTISDSSSSQVEKTSVSSADIKNDDGTSQATSVHIATSATDETTAELEHLRSQLDHFKKRNDELKLELLQIEVQENRYKAQLVELEEQCREEKSIRESSDEQEQQYKAQVSKLEEQYRTEKRLRERSEAQEKWSKAQVLKLENQRVKEKSLLEKQYLKEKILWESSDEQEKRYKAQILKLDEQYRKEKSVRESSVEKEKQLARALEEATEMLEGLLGKYSLTAVEVKNRMEEDLIDL